MKKKTVYKKNYYTLITFSGHSGVNYILLSLNLTPDLPFLISYFFKKKSNYINFN